jgi:hypothetical protein
MSLKTGKNYRLEKAIYYKLSLFYQWYYFIRICCTPDIILPSRKRRVINLKTIHRETN